MGSAQIVPVLIGDSQKAVAVADSLYQKGYRVFPIRPPTVPKGKARLRFSLNYDHGRKMLDGLISDMAALNRA
jgi:8-amino-7-oxononanoate synthase